MQRSNPIPTCCTPSFLTMAGCPSAEIVAWALPTVADATETPMQRPIQAQTGNMYGGSQRMANKDNMLRARDTEASGSSSGTPAVPTLLPESQKPRP